MTMEMIRTVFAWCAVINIGMLLFWFLFFVFAHNWLYKFHSKWSKLSTEKFDAIHYAGMALYEVCIVLFILGPYIALRIVG